jgi:transcriptional regulator GlxA family with amidase domain
MKISIIAFDNFTDIDLWFIWDLLNRVKNLKWEIKILGSSESHLSQTGIVIPMHGPLSEANNADVVLFISGPGTRKLITDSNFLASFNLNPEKQLIGSMCSGALILAALGILKPGDEATTYPTVKAQLETFGINVVEKAFVEQGNIATAAGCLSAQNLAGWVISKLAGEALKDTVLKSIQPVGQGLYFENANLNSLYSAP